MRWYADGPRRVRQVIGDVTLVVWVVAWIFVGRGVHQVIASVARPVDHTASTASGLRDQLTQTAARLGKVPGVGDELGQPFLAMAGELSQLIDQANNQAQQIRLAAVVISVVIAAAPILAALGWRLPRRIGFARAAGAAQRFIDANEDLDLFALRALANQPMTVLARISDDPMGAWRRRDPEIVRELARVELRRVGLHPPALTERC